MIRFTGIAYRMVFAGDDATVPVTSASGRFHHSGQWAIYTSLSARGCITAIQRYLRPNDPPRQIQPLKVTLDRVADYRGDARASVIWQDDGASGRPATTWVLSDQARAAGAQGLIYSSRSRPDLQHLVLFHANPSSLALFGPATNFSGS